MAEIYVNGQFLPEGEAKVSVYDHGFLYGDGVFEGIRAYDGKVFKLEEHMDRLYDSARAVKLEIPMDKDEMKEAILETLRRNELRDAYIRPIISRGKGNLGLDPGECETSNVFIIVQEWEALYGDLYEEGLTAVTVAIRRNNPDALPPNIKSLNYLNNILAKIEANEKGGDEAIFLDNSGKVSEGSGDNLFTVKSGAISTPPTLNNLRGITRSTVIEIGDEKGFEVMEKDIGLYELYTADEVFVTGTAAEVAPIVEIDGRMIGEGKPGEVTRMLMDEFKSLTGEVGEPIYG